MGEFSEDFDCHCDEGERLTSCKYCGKEDLFWSETMQGWRLFTSEGHLHECKKHNNNEGNQ